MNITIYTAASIAFLQSVNSGAQRKSKHYLLWEGRVNGTINVAF